MGRRCGDVTRHCHHDKRQQKSLYLRPDSPLASIPVEGTPLSTDFYSDLKKILGDGTPFREYVVHTARGKSLDIVKRLYGERDWPIASHGKVFRYLKGTPTALELVEDGTGEELEDYIKSQLKDLYIRVSSDVINGNIKQGREMNSGDHEMIMLLQDAAVRLSKISFNRELLKITENEKHKFWSMRPDRRR